MPETECQIYYFFGEEVIILSYTPKMLDKNRVMFL